MSVISHEGRFCHVGEFNISENLNDLLSCHLQHSQAGQGVSVPALFWVDGYVFCCCSYGLGFVTQQGKQASPTQHREGKVCLAWSLPLICAAEMKAHQPILESPVQKGLTFAVAKPQSAFFRGVLRHLIETAKEASE